MSAGLRRDALGALLAVAGAAAVTSLALDAESSGRVLSVALEADDAVAVCRRSSYPLGDFLDRARAMGASAVVLREKPVSYLAERGEVLLFTRQEIEKWRALGLVAPGASLKSNALWTKDPAIVAQLAASAERRGVAISTGAGFGYEIVEFPGGLDPGLPAGVDPELVAALARRPLIRLRAVEGRPDAAGLAWTAEGRVDGTLPAEPGAELRLDAVSLPVDAPPARWLRAAFSSPRRLLLARFKSDEGVEENLARLRSALRLLESRGASPSPPSRPPTLPADSPWRAALRRTAGWLLGVLGPLFAARAGLIALKRVRSIVALRWPILAPVPQIAAGVAMTTVAAVGIGLAARLAFDGGRTTPPASWAFWTLLGPLLIGALTLYAIDLDEWGARLARPITGRGVLLAAASLAAAAALLAPRAAARLVGAALPSGLPGPAWWLSWRWREVLIGVPCLIQALVLINWRVECPDCEAEKGPWADPRGWFLLGMLAPIGVIVALCRSGAPIDLVLDQTGLGLLAGATLGAAGAVWRARAAAGPKGPAHRRTIVPDARI